MEKDLEQVEEKSKLRQFYDHQYKRLLIIPFLLLVIAVIILGVKFSSTGNFVEKDVSLKGGVTVTVPSTLLIDNSGLEAVLKEAYPSNDIDVRALKRLGSQVGFIVNADIDGSKREVVDAFIQTIEGYTGLVLNDADYSLEFIGSSLGASFFKEIIRAMIYSFILMGIVIFIYFRSLVPSVTVVFAVFSDLIVTLGIVSLFGIQLSSAGIAAFLMIIGYSVDTNVLLSNKVLKTKEGTVLDRIFVAMKTGMMMTSTTLVVVIVSLFFTQSEVIRQIMTILLIGLCVDLINTWIQNAGLLRLHLEKKHKGENG